MCYQKNAEPGERILIILQTRSVLIPFVRPEVVIVLSDVLPIHVHISQKGGLSSSFQDTIDILLLMGTVTVCIKSAIAAVQVPISEGTEFARESETHWLGKSPCMVHESVGPVLGFVSQNYRPRWHLGHAPIKTSTHLSL